MTTYSMVVPLEPAENWPSMKMPVGKLTLPLKASWLNSYEKVVDDIVGVCDALGIGDYKTSANVGSTCRANKERQQKPVTCIPRRYPTVTVLGTVPWPSKSTPSGLRSSLLGSRHAVTRNGHGEFSSKGRQDSPK